MPRVQEHLLSRLRYVRARLAAQLPGVLLSERSLVLLFVWKGVGIDGEGIVVFSLSLLRTRFAVI